MADFLQRRTPGANGTGVALPIVRDNWAEVHPALFEYLTLSIWDNGDERETATLLLFVEDGTWKACLHDREEQRVAWVSAGTLTGLLDRLEAGCKDDDLEWRKKSSVGPRKRG